MLLLVPVVHRVESQLRPMPPQEKSLNTWCDAQKMHRKHWGFTVWPSKEYGFNAISWDILINKASSFFIWK